MIDRMGQGLLVLLGVVLVVGLLGGLINPTGGAASQDVQPFQVATPRCADRDNDGDFPLYCGGTDCDDLNPSINGRDADRDGASSCAGDCDESDPLVRYGRSEVCDGRDNDCNGIVDDGC